MVSTQFLVDLRAITAVDPRLALRVFDLIDAIMRDPFMGIGKPEPLRHSAANAWSRRLTDRDRLVYIVERDRVLLLQARFHYKE